MNPAIMQALSIMGMGMLGIFVAMLIIMLVTTVLKKLDVVKKES